MSKRLISNYEISSTRKKDRKGVATSEHSRFDSRRHLFDAVLSRLACRRRPLVVTTIVAAVIIIVVVGALRREDRLNVDGSFSIDNELSLRAAFVNLTIGNEGGGGGEEISELLASAAGVYRDSELRERHNMSNTILLTSSNSGMKDFLENWMCHANRLNYTFLVHSLDKELHEDLTARGIPSIVIIESSSNFSGWGQTAYHTIVKMKFDVVMLALRQGYDVFFSDIDIGFFNDPFPLFRRDCDLEFQTESFESGEEGLVSRNVNTGFYHAKSNERVLELFQTARDDPRDRGGNQRIINSILANWSMPRLRPDEAKRHEGGVRLMDPLRIVVGNAHQNERAEYLAAVEHANFSLADIGIIHANFVIGRDRKLDVLKRIGTWLFKEGEGCEAFSLDDAVEDAEVYFSRSTTE